MFDVKNYIPYDDIVDTSALSLKKLNDQLRYMRNKLQGGLSGLDLYPHSVTADQIDVTTLHVGTGGITLDESAFIAFGIAKASDIPVPYTSAQVAALWKASGYGTYIDENGIYSPTMMADQITSLGAISGCTLRTSNTTNYVSVWHQWVEGLYNNKKKFILSHNESDTSGAFLMLGVDIYNDPNSLTISGGANSANIYWGGTQQFIIDSTGFHFNNTVYSQSNPVLTTASIVTARFA